MGILSTYKMRGADTITADHSSRKISNKTTSYATSSVTDVERRLVTRSVIEQTGQQHRPDIGPCLLRQQYYRSSAGEPVFGSHCRRTTNTRVKSLSGFWWTRRTHIVDYFCPDAAHSTAADSYYEL